MTQKKKFKYHLSESGFTEKEEIRSDDSDNDDDDDDDECVTDYSNPWNEDIEEALQQSYYASSSSSSSNYQKKIIPPEIQFSPEPKWKHVPSEKLVASLKNPSLSESLEYQQCQNDYFLDREGKAVIRSYGTDWEGNTHVTYIHNFRPYFYVDSSPWKDNIEEFTSQITKELDGRLARKDGIRWKGRQPWITEVILRNNVLPFWKYQKNHINVFKVYVGAPNYVRILCTHLKNKDGTTRGTARLPVQTYEGDIQYVLRQMIDCGIWGSSWVRIPGGKYKVRSTSEKETSADVEMDIDYRDIHQISTKEKGNEKYLCNAPHRLLSLDIECCGLDGHFPKPETGKVIDIACIVTTVGNEAKEFKEPFTGKKYMKTEAEWDVVFTLKETAPLPGMIIYWFENEEDLLLSFRDFHLQINAMILTGYNHTGFDIPYLMNRAKALGIGDEFSQLGMVYGERCKVVEQITHSKQRGMRKVQRVDLRGRTYFDPMVVFMRETKLPSYSLNAVCAAFLGDQKDEVDHSHIPQLFNGTPQQRAKLAKYCHKDTLLPLHLIARRNLLLNAFQLSRVTGVPLSFVYERGQIIQIVSQILRELMSTDYIMPDLLARILDDIFGAKVFTPKAKYYTSEEPVATEDFESLYPSIMMAYNLCFTTNLDESIYQSLSPDQYDEMFIVAPEGETNQGIDDTSSDEIDVAEPIRVSTTTTNEEQKIHSVDSSNVKKNNRRAKKRPPLIDAKNKKNGDDVKFSGKIHQFFKKMTPPDEVNELKRPRDEESIDNASRKKKINGKHTRFVKPSIREGILPRILKRLLAERKEAKKMMNKYAEDGETPDPVLYSIYNALQLVLKICANSIYGFTGASVGPLYMPDISNTVTARGRELIQKSADWVCKNYPGSEIVYGDTDSIMVRFCVGGTMVTTVEESMKLGISAAKAITEFINHPPIRLTFEKVFAPSLFYKKKKYAGRKWVESEKEPKKPVAVDKIHVAGMETTRRDFPPITGVTMEKVLDYVFKDDDPQKAVEYVKSVVKSLYENTFDIGQLVVTRTFSKEIKDYKAKQPHIALIERMMKRDPTYQPVIGDRIPYVIIDREHIKDIRHKKGKVNADRKEVGTCDKSEDPLYVLENDLPIDVGFYIERQLEKPLRKIFLPVLGSEKAVREIYHGDHTRHRVHSIPKKNSLGLVKIHRCYSCRALLKSTSEKGLCIGCLPKKQNMLAVMKRDFQIKKEEQDRYWNKCFTCADITSIKEDRCGAVRCPQFYKRKRAIKDVKAIEEKMKQLDVGIE